MAREMKDSGFVWLGQIPHDWEIRKLKHYYTLKTGFTPDTKKQEYYDETGYDWVNISDLSDGATIYETRKKISQAYVDAFSPEQIPAGSLMYSFKLSVGQTSFAGKPLFTNEAIASFLASETVDLHYLRYSSSFIIENAQTNIYNAKILNQDLINNAYVPFPPLAEQARIAVFLDRKCAEIDSVIADTQRTIEEYKKLKQSVITQAVTKGIRGDRPLRDSGVDWIGAIPEEWECKPIKYVAIFQPSCDTSDLQQDSIITYTPMECIKNGYYVQNTAMFGTVTPSLTPFENGDIAMAKVTPCFENGNIAIMDNLASGFGMGSSELFVYRPTAINTRYLLYWLQNDLFKQAACATMTGTGGLKRVSPYFAKHSATTVPSEIEQSQIVEYLDEKCIEIDRLVDAKQQFLTELEAYKKSLIYEYVTGKKEVPACQ